MALIVLTNDPFPDIKTTHTFVLELITTRQPKALAVYTKTADGELCIVKIINNKLRDKRHYICNENTNSVIFGLVKRFTENVDNPMTSIYNKTPGYMDMACQQMYGDDNQKKWSELNINQQRLVFIELLKQNNLVPYQMETYVADFTYTLTHDKVCVSTVLEAKHGLHFIKALCAYTLRQAQQGRCVQPIEIESLCNGMKQQCRVTEVACQTDGDGTEDTDGTADTDKTDGTAETEETIGYDYDQCIIC